MKRALPLLLVFAVLACGDDPFDPSQPFEQTINGTIEPGGTTSHSLTTPRGGTLQAVLTWANGQIDLDLYLTADGCNGYPPEDCTLLDSSTSFTGTQETVQRTVNSDQQYKVWVDSFSGLESNYSIEVTID